MSEEIIEAKFSQDMDLERLLSEIGEGFRMVIKRVEPEWCDGHLATINLDPEEPISMDSLRRRFGGRKLHFKIQKANGDYVAHRTVKFPDQPRHDGVIMVPGGSWGDTPQNARGNPGGQSGDVAGDMKSVFEMVLTGQRETSQMMISTLTSRVAHLETTLQTAQNQALGLPAPVTPGSNAEHFQGIKESIKTIQEIEKFKEAIGVSGVGKTEPTMIESGLEKIMDLMLKKEEIKMQAAMSSQATTQKAPELGAASCYTAPANNGVDSMSDMELASYVKNRLSGMSEQERLNIISHVADIDLVEDETEVDLNNGQEAPEPINIDKGLPGVELTEQDASRLDAGNDNALGAPKAS